MLDVLRGAWIACWSGGAADERSHPTAGAGRGRVCSTRARSPSCAPLFTTGAGFFLAADKVQVKYEMLRAHLVDQLPVTEAAAAHGYSRAAFYLVSASFDQLGMAGLLDERRGRRGPVKLSPEIVEFIRSAAPGSGAQIAEQVADGVRGAAAPADRRTGPRPVTARSFWPPAEASSGRLRNAPRAPARARPAARRAGRCPVRPPRCGRADRVAGRRAGVRC